MLVVMLSSSAAVTFLDGCSHRPLDELPLQIAFPPGVQEAAPHSQGSAGLRRVELDDGQRQRGQDCHAEGTFLQVTQRKRMGGGVGLLFSQSWASQITRPSCSTCRSQPDLTGSLTV